MSKKNTKEKALRRLLKSFYFNGVCHQATNSMMTFDLTYDRFLDELEIIEIVDDQKKDFDLLTKKEVKK